MAEVRRRTGRPRHLIRQPGWERRLVAWAECTVGRPFAWGTADCAVLAAEAIAAITAQPDLHAGALRGVRPYSSRFGALRSMRETGCASVRLYGMGLRQVAIPYLQHGDLVVSLSPGEALEDVSVVVSGRLLGVPHGEGSVVQWYAIESARDFGLRI